MAAQRRTMARGVQGEIRMMRRAAGGSALYVEGNTVRKVVEAPEHKVSELTKSNRERSMQMNMRYVVFLTAAAVICVMMCRNYVRLKAQYTALRTRATSLEVSLSQKKLANDAEYDRIMASVNLAEVKDIAMEKLGMVYAAEDQIVSYDVISSDYVKQYQEIPE